MFTRKHYIKLANMIKSGELKPGNLDEFCAELKADNPRFNKERFLEACGV